MASTNSKTEGSEMLVRGVEWKVPDFKIVPTIAEALDPSGAQSQIPSKVLLINDIRNHFKGTIQELGTLEIDLARNELCVNGVLKPEHKHLEDKGLTHITHLPRSFQIKWIRYILSRVLAKAKSTKTLGRAELEKNTLAEWDDRGMKISCIADPELKFGTHVIALKIYSSSRQNSVSCEAVDLAYKIVKNNLSYDLADLMLKKFNKNMESIQTSKNNPCKFVSSIFTS